LKTALAAEFEAKKALDHATEAHKRAAAWIEQCKAQVAAFDGLDAEITDHTVEELRRDGRADLTPELQEKQIARDRAIAAVANAERAEKQLAADLTVARSQRDARYRATHAAIVPLLTIEAEKITKGIRDREAEIAREETRLIGIDMTADRPGSLLPLTHDYIFTKLHGRIPTLGEIKPWRDACERLRADPDAEVVIEQPEPEPPKPHRWQAKSAYPPTHRARWAIPVCIQMAPSLACHRARRHRRSPASRPKASETERLTSGSKIACRAASRPGIRRRRRSHVSMARLG
jgi:hypothetical protein